MAHSDGFIDDLRAKSFKVHRDTTRDKLWVKKNWLLAQSQLLRANTQTEIFVNVPAMFLQRQANLWLFIWLRAANRVRIASVILTGRYLVLQVNAITMRRTAWRLHYSARRFWAGWSLPGRNLASGIVGRYRCWPDSRNHFSRGIFGLVRKAR